MNDDGGAKPIGVRELPESVKRDVTPDEFVSA
jgi:hypothetical protein